MYKFTSSLSKVTFSISSIPTTYTRRGEREGDRQCSEPMYSEPVKMFSLLLKSKAVI